LNRTRNFEEQQNATANFNNDSYSKIQSFQYDSDHTTHKEIYIKHDQRDYPDFEAKITHHFTPKSKRSSLQDSRRSRHERMNNSDYCESKMTSRYKSVNNENDTSSSPEPLSSRLEGSRMMLYETEHMQELYTLEMNQTRNQLTNNHTGLGVYRHINQVSGDKQTPSERNTLIGDPDTPCVEFVPFEDETGSYTELDCEKESKLTGGTSHINIDIVDNEAFEYDQNQHYEIVLAKDRHDIGVSSNQEEVQEESDQEREKFNDDDKYPNDESNDSARVQDKLNQFKDTYIGQSHYLSGITEKSGEESGPTNNLYQNSCYIKERENVNGAYFRHEAFLSSNSSAKSSNINSRLLRYFEDSLQKEIPINMSPLVAPKDRTNNANLSDNNVASRKSHQNFFSQHVKMRNSTDEESQHSSEESKNNVDKSEDLSAYSIAKSHNYSDLKSHDTSGKKQCKYFFSQRQVTDSES
jgi:hypothetical protein